MALQAFSSLLACQELPVFIAAPQFKKLPINRRVLVSGNICQQVFEKLVSSASRQSVHRLVVEALRIYKKFKPLKLKAKIYKMRLKSSVKTIS